MLVISRKTSESIIINGNVEIIISEIGNDKVKLCIDAPKEISIMRRELIDTYSMNREANNTPNKQFFDNFKELSKSIKQRTPTSLKPSSNNTPVPDEKTKVVTDNGNEKD